MWIINKKYTLSNSWYSIINSKMCKMHLNLHVIIKVHAILTRNDVLVQKHKTFSNKRAQYKNNSSQITHWCSIKPRALFYIIECCQAQTTFFKVQLRMILNNLLKDWWKLMGYSMSCSVSGHDLEYIWHHLFTLS